MAVAQGLIGKELDRDVAEVFPAGDLGRQVDVIHRGHRAGKATGAKELLSIKSTVGLAKLGVAISRDIP